MQEPPFYFWMSDGEGWVKVVGAGTFLNSTALKDQVRAMTARGVSAFAIDLAECPLIDSTFMGTLAGLALRLRELGRGRVRILNANPECRKVIADSGLEILFQLEH